MDPILDVSLLSQDMEKLTFLPSPSLDAMTNNHVLVSGLVNTLVFLEVVENVETLLELTITLERDCCLLGPEPPFFNLLLP